MTDTTTTETDSAPDDTPLARMIDPKIAAPPPEEPRKIHGSDAKGLAEATDELVEERNRRQQPEPKIRHRRMPDDGPTTFKNAREAVPWVRTARTVDRAGDRMRRDGAQTQADAWKAGHITAQEMTAEREPSVVEYVGKDKRETVTDRQAAKDLAEYRRTTAVQEAVGAEELRRLAAELGVQDLIAAQQPQTAEQPTAETTPAAEPAPQPEAPDPVAQARARAQAEAQAYAYMRQASQAEHLLVAEAQKWHTGYAAEFRDVQNMEDVSRLSPEKQSRWAWYQDQWRTITHQHQQAAANRELVERRIGEAQQAEQAREFQKFKTEQDALAAKSIPEISGDPETAYAFKAAAAEVLNEVGITPDAYRSFSPDVRRAVHSREFQLLVADATRHRQAQARAKEVSAKPLPPVQRAGVAQAKGSRAAADLSHISERIDRARPGSDRQLRLAANLIATRRANKGR